MVEQWTHKPLVGGSNPPLATSFIKNTPIRGIFLYYHICNFYFTHVL